MKLKKRPRRLRKTPAIRQLAKETSLGNANLIQPYFLSWSNNPLAKESIQGFTEVYRWGIESVSKEIESDLECGLSQFLLFGSTDQKDARGTAATATNNSFAEGIHKLKTRFGDSVVLFSDVCLCPFTDHGQCGLVEENEILNDSSLEVLAKMALTHAQAGVDFVAPSDMMDGRVGAIRESLDEAGYSNTGILAYTAKYASAYYGPFREALDSEPKGMDRKSHQMDIHNRREALRELELDLEEGADIVMVKPALAYLDIIADFAAHSPVPVAAYSVSGEYESVKQLAKAGMADETTLFLENLTAIRRAGASLVISYIASPFARKGILK